MAEGECGGATADGRRRCLGCSALDGIRLGSTALQSNTQNRSKAHKSSSSSLTKTFRVISCIQGSLFFTSSSFCHHGSSNNNDNKPPPKSVSIPVASAIAKSPFEILNDGDNNQVDSIEFFLASNKCNQSQAFF